MYNPITEEKKVVEYRLIDDEHMPPIVITMKEDDKMMLILQFSNGCIFIYVNHTSDLTIKMFVVYV